MGRFSPILPGAVSGPTRTAALRGSMLQLANPTSTLA
jgi:hypothetical protein